MESIGTFPVTVTRDGPDLHNTVYIDYETADGTADNGKDYIATHGTLEFAPGERHKQFEIEIIDDDVFEEDEHFYVRLSNVRLHDRDQHKGIKLELGDAVQATVMILDDDHGGIFIFEESEVSIPEDVGYAALKVVRKSGARGAVTVPYCTRPGTAATSTSYEPIAEGKLVFDDNQTEQEIQIPIVNESKYEKSENFFVELGEPTWYLGEFYSKAFILIMHEKFPRSCVFLFHIIIP